MVTSSHTESDDGPFVMVTALIFEQPAQPLLGAVS
jgi:hypothetical protein